MKQWYAKELSKLVGVSVRTLHHYDKINLLNPSLRQSNNYRLYSEKDLLKLQQIIALKFFGFELSQIKQLLASHTDVVENFSMQAKFLQEKAETLLEASDILKRITESFGNNKSIPLEQIIQLIEIYQMTQHLEDGWVKEIFTQEELKQYVKFETEMKANSTPEQKELFEKNWFNLVEEIKAGMQQDPASEKGIILGKKFMSFVNNLYGKKYAHLRTKKFERGFGEGKGLDQHGLSPEIIAWLEKATDAYFRQRISQVLDQVGKISSSQSMQLWNEIMDEMYGEENERKLVIAEMALKDDEVSPEAKKWLKNNFKLK